MPRFQCQRAFVLLLIGGFAAGCGGVDEGTPVTLVVTVEDAVAESPLAGALVAIEVGGTYRPTPDPAKGNPSYQLGGETDGAGKLTLTVPAGKYGFHSFSAGHFYGVNSADVDADPFEIVIDTLPLGGEAVPTLANVRLEPSTVAPGAEFTVSADAAAPSSSDPLSEEIIAIVPALGLSAAMDPPSAGVPGKMYPDGLYQKTLQAPSQPGTHVVWVSATTEGCVTGPPVAVNLQVE